MAELVWIMVKCTLDMLIYLFIVQETFDMCCISYHCSKLYLNTLRPRQNGRYFADDIFKCIFLNENAWILLKISLKFVPKVRISNIPALVQIMAWRRPGDKPLSEPVMVSLLTHIYVARPQWVKRIKTAQPFILWLVLVTWINFNSSMDK